MFAQQLSGNRRKLALAWVTLATLLAAQFLISATTRSATALALLPVADAAVKAGSPSTNFGSTLRLDAAGTPSEMRSYLRFDLGPVGSRIERATLRLWATRTTSNGISVHGVADSSWVESRVTWSTAPAMSLLLGHSGSLTAGEWVNIDLTDAIEWHRAAGRSRIFSLGIASTPVLTTAAGDALNSFASREAGIFAPRLALRTSGAGSSVTTTTPSPTTTTPPPTTTAPRDPRVVAVPAGIDAAGGRDVTTELTNFLRSVPDHRTIVFPAGARYRVDGTLLLHNRNDLVIEANGALFFSDNDGTLAPRPGSGKDDGLAGLRGHWPRHRAHWVLWGSSGIIVRNIVIRGAHPNAGAHDDAYVAGLEAQHGFEFARDTRNSVIENCRITDTYGDFVYIGPNVENITVRNCHLERSGRQGITVADGNNVTLEHNFVSQTGRTAFDLEPYTTGGKVTNVRIHDNDVGPAHGYFVGSKGAGDVSNISIVGNRLKGEPLHISNRPPRELSPRRHDWYIANNRAENQFGSPRAAIHLIYTIGVTVTGNYVPLQDGRHPAQVGFECIQCSAVSESNNTFVYI